MKIIDIKKLIAKVEAEKANASKHVPYEVDQGRKPDFKVEYELRPSKELADVKVSQGLRSDFRFTGDERNPSLIYKIWPEFLNEEGEVITDKSQTVPRHGFANMWIVSDVNREEILQKAKIGCSGYWVIGSEILAKVFVV